MKSLLYTRRYMQNAHAHTQNAPHTHNPRHRHTHCRIRTRTHSQPTHVHTCSATYSLQKVHQYRDTLSAFVGRDDTHPPWHGLLLGKLTSLQGNCTSQHGIQQGIKHTCLPSQCSPAPNTLWNQSQPPRIAARSRNLPTTRTARATHQHHHMMGVNVHNNSKDSLVEVRRCASQQ